MPTKKIFQVLLLNGADVNSVDSGQRSALLSACWQGHLVIADILLTAGANVNHQCGQVRGSRVLYSEKVDTLPFSLAKGSPSKELREGLKKSMEISIFSLTPRPPKVWNKKRTAPLW